MEFVLLQMLLKRFKENPNLRKNLTGSHVVLDPDLIDLTLIPPPMTPDEVSSHVAGIMKLTLIPYLPMIMDEMTSSLSSFIPEQYAHCSLLCLKHSSPTSRQHKNHAHTFLMGIFYFDFFITLFNTASSSTVSEDAGIKLR